MYKYHFTKTVNTNIEFVKLMQSTNMTNKIWAVHTPQPQRVEKIITFFGYNFDHEAEMHRFKEVPVTASIAPCGGYLELVDTKQIEHPGMYPIRAYKGFTDSHRLSEKVRSGIWEAILECENRPGVTTQFPYEASLEDRVVLPRTTYLTEGRHNVYQAVNIYDIRLDPTMTQKDQIKGPYNNGVIYDLEGCWHLFVTVYKNYTVSVRSDQDRYNVCRKDAIDYLAIDGYSLWNV